MDLKICMMHQMKMVYEMSFPVQSGGQYYDAARIPSEILTALGVEEEDAPIKSFLSTADFFVFTLFARTKQLGNVV